MAASDPAKNRDAGLAPAFPELRRSMGAAPTDGLRLRFERNVNSKLLHPSGRRARNNSVSPILSREINTLQRVYWSIYSSSLLRALDPYKESATSLKYVNLKKDGQGPVHEIKMVSLHVSLSVLVTDPRC